MAPTTQARKPASRKPNARPRRKAKAPAAPAPTPPINGSGAGAAGIALAPTAGKLHAAHFPQQLREAKRWLLWADAGPGRKLPHYANGNLRGTNGTRNADGTPHHFTLDSPEDVAQLVTFDEALAAWRDAPKRYAGLGFALGERWHGIDLDDVRDPASGAFAQPWVAAAVARARRDHCYVEISPSGCGIHIIGFGESLGTYDKGGIEIYSGKRFFTMTGWHLGGALSEQVGSAQAVRELLPITRDERPAEGPQPLQIDAGALPAGKVTTGWLADRETMRQELARAPADCSRQRWVRIGMGLHKASGGSADGLALWEQWSATATRPGKYVPGDCEYNWNHFKRSHEAGAVTLGTAIYEARAERFEASAGDGAPIGSETNPANDEDLLPLADIHAEPVEREPIIDGWLIDRVVVLQAADGGSGKSFLALLEGLMVALGVDCGIGMKVKRKRVLYYSGEDDSDTINSRARRYCKLFGWNYAQLTGWWDVVDRSKGDCTLYAEERYVDGKRMPPDFTLEFSRLLRTARALGVGYLIVDNVSHVFAGNENSRAQVRQFVSGFNLFGCAVNMLAHVNKPTAIAQAGGGQQSLAGAYSGVTAWSNTVRSRRVQTKDESGRGRVEIAKANYGPTGAVIGYEWNDLHKLFVPTGFMAQRAKPDAHHQALLVMVDSFDQQNRLASLYANTQTYLGKLILAAPDAPKGLHKTSLKEWIDKQVARGAIEGYDVKKPDRKDGKAVRLTALGRQEAGR